LKKENKKQLQAFKLYRDNPGMFKKEMARILNISYVTLRRWRIKYNWDQRVEEHRNDLLNAIKSQQDIENINEITQDKISELFAKPIAIAINNFLNSGFVINNVREAALLMELLLRITEDEKSTTKELYEVVFNWGEIKNNQLITQQKENDKVTQSDE